MATRITALPTPPTRNDPGGFAARGDAFLAALPAFASEANDLAGEVNADAVLAGEKAQLATVQAQLATTNGAAQVALATVQAQLATTNGAAQVALATVQAVRAEAAATTALGAAHFAGVWSELSGPLAAPASAYHAGQYWGLLHDVADVTAHEPGVSSQWAAVSIGIDHVDYDERSALRAKTPVDGDLALVEALGLFRFAAGSDEPDDDESCFATASGRWLLECPHWDVVSMWQLPDDAMRDESDEDAQALFGAHAGLIAGQAVRWPGRVLFGTADSAITSVSVQSKASFTGAVPGAAVGDRVLATPPDALDTTGRISYFARVTAADTVTVYLNNPSGATATLAAGTWQLAVFKEI